MPTPKSVTKIDKNGVRFVSDVDKTEYFIYELSRAALRDVGKYVSKIWRDLYYSHFKKHTGKAGKATKYKVISGKNTTAPRVQIGLKTGQVDGFYAYFQEFGTSRTPRLGLLTRSVEDNIAKIVEIESQYLSGLEDEASALAKIDEKDYDGGADNE